ncbi:MAG TPA: hypothetical protein H9671_11065 [Firmicutes bacterium]|nr:hypothetical protein [Bacillota bacterium]
MNAPTQLTRENSAITFAENTILTGTFVCHKPGSPDIVIYEPGIYLISFNGTLALGPGTNSPGTILISLRQNGVAKTGGQITDTLTLTRTPTTGSFTLPIQVSATPTTLQMVASAEGFLISNASLSVLKIGKNI